MFDSQTRYLGHSPISAPAPLRAPLRRAELDSQNELTLNRLFNEKAAEPALKPGCAKSCASVAEIVALQV